MLTPIQLIEIMHDAAIEGLDSNYELAKVQLSTARSKMAGVAFVLSHSDEPAAALARKYEAELEAMKQQMIKKHRQVHDKC